MPQRGGGNKRSEKQQRERQGQRRRGRRCSTCRSRYPPLQPGKDPSWSRWICPKGTAAHGEPLPEQISFLKDCSQHGAHTRAEGKREKEGAAERNHLSLTITPLPPASHGEGHSNLACRSEVEPGKGGRKSVAFTPVFLFLTI